MAASDLTPEQLRERQLALTEQIMAELERYYQGSVVQSTPSKRTRKTDGQRPSRPSAYLSRDTRRGMGHAYLPLALVPEVEQGVERWKAMKEQLRELADVNLRLLKAHHRSEGRARS